jgi:DUF2946 family protein
VVRWLFPVSILAIVLQICLPVVAVRAAAASFDPFDNLALCHASDDGRTGDDGRIPDQHHHNICPLCQVAPTPHVALLSVPITLPVPSLVSSRRISDPAQSAGPRGPPFRGVQARAPPVIS